MMTYGFTFKGRHCSELGVRLLRYNVHSPELREHEDEVTGMPGAIDYGTEYGKRDIEVTIDIDPDDRSFKRRQSEILSWLSPVAPADMLVFDDMPDRYFIAKMTGRLSAEQIGSYGELRVTFKCVDPFARSLTASDAVILDSDVRLDSDIRLNDAWSFVVNSGTTARVNNWGAESLRPTIVITGSFSTITISTGGVTFAYNAAIANKTLTIDGERETARIDGVSVLQHVTGDFITLAPGDNDVVIGGAALNCTVAFVFNAKYI